MNENFNLVSYKVDGQEIQLTKEVVKNYLCPNSNITDQEFYLFASLCKARNINPFIREAYIVKFGDSANIFAGKDFFVRRAAANPDYDGIEDGVIAMTQDGDIKYLDGCFVPDSMTLVGGWAKVYLKSVSKPKYVTLNIKEYAKVKKDGTYQSNWATMPAVMINKCAKVAALREAFPLDFNGIYTEEEFNGNYVAHDQNTGEVIDVVEVIDEPADENQINKIKQLVGRNFDLADKLRKHYHFQELNELNVTQASEIIKALSKKK